MNYKIFIYALVTLAVAVNAFTHTYAAAGPAVTVNGRIIEWINGAEPYEDEGGVMLPLRRITEAFNGVFTDVDLNYKTIFINNMVLGVLIGSGTAYVSHISRSDEGIWSYSEPAAYAVGTNVVEKNGEVFFPLDAFSQILEIKIDRTADIFDFIFPEISIPTAAPEPTPAPEPPGPATVPVTSPELTTTPGPAERPETKAIVADIKIIINGEDLALDTPLYMIGDRLMAPARGVFEALGAVVAWDESAQTITAETNGVVIVLQIGGVVMNLNGWEIILDSPPRLEDGVALLPARAVAEGLGADVEWDAVARTVKITRELYYGEF